MDDNAVIGGFTGRLQKPRLLALLGALKCPQESIRNAINDLYLSLNLDSAHGAQLDLIGDILGQSRTLTDAVHLEFFGYQGQTSAKGYGQARYRQTGESTLGGMTTLADEEYRKLLRWRKDYVKARGTVSDIKKAVVHIFGSEDGLSVQRTAPAEITISLPRQASGSSYLAIAERFIPAPAGVRVVFKINGKLVE